MKKRNIDKGKKNPRLFGLDSAKADDPGEPRIEPHRAGSSRDAQRPEMESQGPRSMTGKIIWLGYCP
jgi:hypothetical protein